MKTWDARLTRDVAKEICRRSAEGDGVMAVIADMGLPDETLDWLKDGYQGMVIAAKQEQIKRKREKAEKDKDAG